MTYDPNQPALFTIVTAVIPNADNPAQHIHDRNGNYPSVIHEDGIGTWERSFQNLGRSVVGRYVCVDFARDDLMKGRGNLVYQSRPVRVEFPSDNPYQWHED